MHWMLGQEGGLWRSYVAVRDFFRVLFFFRWVVTFFFSFSCSFGGLRCESVASVLMPRDGWHVTRRISVDPVWDEILSSEVTRHQKKL